MADIDKNPATLLAEQAALDPPQRREVDVAAALRNVAETRPNMWSHVIGKRDADDVC
jgi:hypothetical protein